MRKAVNHLKKRDPIMRAVIERVGPCRMEFGPPEFHSLAESIVYQQLNGKAAATIFERFAALAGDPLTPAGILKLTDEQLRSVGLSKQKSAYLKDLAEKTSSGLLDFARLPEQSDDEVIAHLTQVKGIGVWTAHMFLMFTLKRENVLPTGDYGIRMAIFKHYLDRKNDRKKAKMAGAKAVNKKEKPSARKPRPRKIKLPSPEQMEKIAKSWEPYRSVACWYLWRSLDIKTL
jgi:3-methyladenine DNA glycosylase/8-oxoguanine DNA glycosylase